MSTYIRQLEGDDGFVRKLDDSRFENIKSGIKSYDGLQSEFLQKKYVTLHNLVKKEKVCRGVPASRSNITWVADCWEKIRDWIKTRYTDVATLRINLEVLANLLLAINKHKYREDVRPFFNTGKRLQNLKDAERDESLFTEDELNNLVKYPDLVKERDRWMKAWKEEPKNLKNNMYHLILSLVTYNPPLRKNYHDMEIYRDKKPPPRDKTNYLWEKHIGQWVIVINYDKVENKREAQHKSRSEFELLEEIPGVTNGKKLNEIINESLKQHPREFLLVGVKTITSPMGGTSFDKALASIFDPKKPATNLIRKAYVNYWYRKNLSNKTLDKIADRMRHSRQVGRDAYFKINYPEGDEPDEDYTGAVIRPPPKPVPKPEPKEYFDPRKYAKEYRLKNKDKIKEKRKENYNRDKHKILRNKILFNLNVAQVTKHPRQDTIDKYDIKYDAKQKKWV